MTKKFRFFDGKTANPYEINITLYNQKLIGKVSARKIIIEWNINDIRIIQEPRNNRSAIIACKKDNEARLYIDSDMLKKLNTIVGKKSRPLLSIGISIKSILFWLMLSVLLVFTVYKSIPNFSSYVIEMIPKQWEIKLGKNIFKEIKGDKEICMAKAGISSLNKIVAKLHNKPYKLNIRVINHDEVNAYAIPGDNIVIYMGLIKTADFSEEVAGVIAHEIGHIYEQHPMKMHVQYFGLYFLAKTMLGLEDISILALLNYGRDMEIQADKMAINLLKENDISMQGLYNFFKKVKKDEEQGIEIPKFLSTHPMTSERLNMLSKKLEAKDYIPVLSRSEWQALKNICQKNSIKKVQ